MVVTRRRRTKARLRLLSSGAHRRRINPQPRYLVVRRIRTKGKRGLHLSSEAPRPRTNRRHLPSGRLKFKPNHSRLSSEAAHNRRFKRRTRVVAYLEATHRRLGRRRRRHSSLRLIPLVGSVLRRRSLRGRRLRLGPVPIRTPSLAKSQLNQI